MDLPIADLMDGRACSDRMDEVLHPDGLASPRCRGTDDSIHRVEADEVYRNAGVKGIPHVDPDDPPRRRANKARGHGTWENDRVPIAGAVGRVSGRFDLKVERRSSRAELVDAFVLPATAEKATVCTHGVRPKFDVSRFDLLRRRPGTPTDPLSTRTDSTAPVCSCTFRDFIDAMRPG
jgi:hypothetical protein